LLHGFVDVSVFFSKYLYGKKTKSGDVFVIIQGNKKAPGDTRGFS
jgi:hypothetical protein